MTGVRTRRRHRHVHLHRSCLLSRFEDEELAHHPLILVHQQVAVEHVRERGIGVLGPLQCDANPAARRRVNGVLEACGSAALRWRGLRPRSLRCGSCPFVARWIMSTAIEGSGNASFDGSRCGRAPTSPGGSTVTFGGDPYAFDDVEAVVHPEVSASEELTPPPSSIGNDTSVVVEPDRRRPRSRLVRRG